jgi:3-hydroxybutyryl-CoA dehydrogenase
MEVHKIAVIGAGTMGHGIAQVSAMAGFQVNIVDIDDTRLKQAQIKIKENLQKGVDLQDRQRIAGNFLQVKFVH